MAENEEEVNNEHPVENQEVTPESPYRIEEIDEDVITSEVADLTEQEEKERLEKIAKIRLLHQMKVLTRKEMDVLSTLKEEELTDEDRSRIALAVLRMRYHRYTGTGYSAAQAKNAKRKRQMAKASRKANR